MLREQAGELRHWLIVESRRRIEEQLCLRVQRFDHAFVAMTKRIDRPALNEIQVALAVVVVEPRALAVRENDFGPVGDVHQRLDRILIEIHDGRLQTAGKRWMRRKSKKATACRGFHDSNSLRFVWRESVTKPAASLRKRRAATSKFGLDAVHARKNTTRKAPV